MTFTLTPTASGTHLSLVQSGFKPHQKQNLGGALRLEDDGREARGPAREDHMKWNYWIRQIHRLLSIAFTVAIIVTFIALRQEKPPVWVNFLALPPLFLFLFTGLYLFVLPHATRWRSGRRTDSIGSRPHDVTHQVGG